MQSLPSACQLQPSTPTPQGGWRRLSPLQGRLRQQLQRSQGRRLHSRQEGPKMGISQ